MGVREESSVDPFRCSGQVGGGGGRADPGAEDEEGEVDGGRGVDVGARLGPPGGDEEVRGVVC